MGHWSARHRKKAIFGWLAFVIVAFALGSAAGTNELDPEDAGVGESGDGAKVVADAFPDKAEETVLVQSGNLTVTDARFRAAVADVVRRLERTEGVREVVSPYSTDALAQISADRHSAIVDFEIPGEPEDTEELVDGPLAAVAAAQRANPDLRIAEFGAASADKAVSKSFEDDLKKAEVTSLPITLAILIVAFGALMAAGIPLLLAITGVIGTFGLVGVISQVAPVDQSIQNVILLIGLAVGVDYSLFYLRREREERAAGRSEQAALQAAAATSGRAVLISGLTVMIAMAGMFLAGAPTFTSFATGTILVVAVTLIGSLTVLPALLSKLGDRVDRGRVPLLGRVRRRAGEAGLWSRVVDRVLRRPLVSAVLSAGFLLVLAVPTLGLHTALPGIDSLPRDLEVMQTYDRVQAAFPSESEPATVVVEADDVTSPEVATAIARLESAARERQALFEGPPTVEISRDRTVSEISYPIAGDGTNDASYRALDELRDDLIPATLGAVDGIDTHVTGVTAETRDFNDAIKSHVPFVFGFVLLAAFALLLVTFRSVVIAVKAIVLNLLSVAAAYGVLVFLFQDGHGESLFGFESTGSITAWLPLFMFVVLFGLSMDYHVFILTRVREAFDRGMSTEDAVSHAIKSTAGVVTSAALVMVGVFAVFATLSSIELKQMGVGLAVAVLLDATIIRAVLLPATMKLLGDWNWWLPKSLEWLPTLRTEEAFGSMEAAATEPFAVNVHRHGSDVLVELRGELDLATAKTLHERLEAVERDNPELLVIDLRNLRFMDSGGLREVIGAVRRGRSDGRRVVLVKRHGPIEDMLDITKVDQMTETVEDPATVGFPDGS